MRSLYGDRSVLPLPRLWGRVGVGVLPQSTLVERIDLPPPAALRRAIALPSAAAEAQLRRSKRRPLMAAYAPPQAGEVKLRLLHD